jgi:hypothetical protein
VSQPRAALNGGDTVHTTMAAALRTQLELCDGSNERGQRALRVLLDCAAADEGFLYVCSEIETVTLVAASSDVAEPDSLRGFITDWLRHSGVQEETQTASSSPTSTTGPLPGYSVIELVTDSGGAPVLAGIAALRAHSSGLIRVPVPILSALADGLIGIGDSPGRPWVN